MSRHNAAESKGTKHRARTVLWVLWPVMLVGGMLLSPRHLDSMVWQRPDIWGLDRSVINQAISSAVRDNRYPRQIAVNTTHRRLPATLHYNIDPELQKSVMAVFADRKDGGPDYGIFVALDPENGDVLALVNHRRQSKSVTNLALRATYPSASVFKIVTASAAVDLGRVNANSVIPFNGKTTSLYRKNVLHHKNNKWTRYLPLSASFGKSVNTVFGRLGLEYVGAEALLDYANRFGFNQGLNGDFAVDLSRAQPDPEDDWSVVEAASGYTRETTMSPVHGALLAASIVNGGRLVRPSLIDSITDENGIVLYANDELLSHRVIEAHSAGQLQDMMADTVLNGTARKHFRNFFRGNLSDVRVGGKTGTLYGTNPKGMYDWFVGYAQRGDRKLAYAALCINQEKWRVKSAHVARKAIEHYFTARN